MIYHDYKKGLAVANSNESLVICFGKIASRKATVYKWYNEFKQDRRSLKDETRPSRPVSAVTPKNISAAEQMIREDPQITVKEMKDVLGIKSSAVETILHKHLMVHTRFARWVPNELSDEQKRGRVKWCKTMLDKFDSGRSKSTWKVISGDETWVY